MDKSLRFSDSCPRSLSFCLAAHSRALTYLMDKSCSEFTIPCTLSHLSLATLDLYHLSSDLNVYCGKQQPNFCYFIMRSHSPHTFIQSPLPQALLPPLRSHTPQFSTLMYLLLQLCLCSMNISTSLQLIGSVVGPGNWVPYPPPPFHSPTAPRRCAVFTSLTSKLRSTTFRSLPSFVLLAHTAPAPGRFSTTYALDSRMVPPGALSLPTTHRSH